MKPRFSAPRTAVGRMASTRSSATIDARLIATNREYTWLVAGKAG